MFGVDLTDHRTFDISILTIEEGIFEVKATAGDTHLGLCISLLSVIRWSGQWERNAGGAPGGRQHSIKWKDNSSQSMQSKTRAMNVGTLEGNVFSIIDR